MKNLPAMLLALPLAAVVASADDMPLEQTIQKAITNFAPLDEPPPTSLRGWTIGIIPGERTSAADTLRSEELSLLTAEHLYHLVRAAGGTPVLTRADIRLSAATGAGVSDSGRTVTILRDKPCDVCLCVRYSAGTVDAAMAKPVVRVVSGTECPRADHLVQKLADALGGEAAPPIAADDANAACAAAAHVAAELPDLIVCDVQLPAAESTAVLDTAARNACRMDALRIVTGLAAHVAAEPKEAPAAADVVAEPNIPSDGIDEHAQHLARAIWPRGSLPREQVNWFCERFAGTAISNPTLVYFDVTAEVAPDGVVLCGATNVPTLVEGLTQTLRAAGIENVRSTVRALPDRERLGQHLFGVCCVPSALTYDRPGRGALQTQLLLGEPVFLLDRQHDYYLLHAADGYWGWVPAATVHLLTDEKFDARAARPQCVLREDAVHDGLLLPRGATLPLASVTEQACTLLLPDGSAAELPWTSVGMPDVRRAEAGARVHAALDLLYVPYVFGGRSPLGLDCSGLVTNVEARVGRHPARDARQQVLAGKLVATAWHREAIQAGDQLFFISSAGKVYHTAIALDATHFVHSSLPCVQISSFNPDDPRYAAGYDRSFFMAKRP